MEARQPVMVFDGDCGFCGASVARLRAITGARVGYVPSQRAEAEFPGLRPADVAASVQFFDATGRRWDRAAAVFRALGTTWAAGRWLAWAHARVPGFGRLCDAAYDLVARNRMRLSRWLGTTACRVR